MAADPIPYRYPELSTCVPCENTIINKSTEDAEAWYASARAHSDKLLEELALANARGIPGLATVDGCPVRVIREVQENGEDVFIGEIDVFRCSDGRKLAISATGMEVGEGKKKKYVEWNMRYAVGDPRIVWFVRGMSVCEFFYGVD
jgi:hypothetical protein